MVESFLIILIIIIGKTYFLAIAITWLPSSLRKHFNLLLENHGSKRDQMWQEFLFAWSNQVLLLSLRSVIQHGCQDKILRLAEIF